MERLFNLDPQLIHDAVLLALAVFVMFTFLSYLLFNPARDFLKKRQDKIKNDLDIPAFSPIFRLFIEDILADSAIMVKSVRLCRTEPAIFKEDIIMSKIVNEAKIGHLRSGLLPLLPDIHCLHRRRFSAWPSRLSCSEDAAG